MTKHSLSLKSVQLEKLCFNWHGVTYVTCELKAPQNALLHLLTWGQKYRFWCHQPLISVDLHLNTHYDCCKSDLSLGELQLAFFQLMCEEFIRFFIHFRLVDQPHRGPQFGTLALHKEAFPFTYSLHWLFSFPSSPLESVTCEKQNTKGTDMSDWISISHCCQCSGQQVFYNMVSLVEYLLCFHYQLLSVHPLSL